MVKCYLIHACSVDTEIPCRLDGITLEYALEEHGDSQP